MAKHRDADVGYALHAHLRAVFGELAPQPFRHVSTEGRYATVLGYSSAGETELIDSALSLGWESLATKSMPTPFARGTDLGFEVRVCPVVRKARGAAHAGKEKDAFLAALDNGQESPQRETVYQTWLGERFAGVASLRGVGLQSFQRSRFFRRAQADASGLRKGKLVERPDAILGGRLIVEDPTAFDALLRRGVGRHRAFGFGMILLRA